MNKAEADPIRLVVGLGNPGARYDRTRHNAGFWCADKLAAANGGVFKLDSRFHAQLARLSLAGHDCWLLKPATFMNRSGQAVAGFARYLKIPPPQMLIVHDELDLPVGSVRLKQGGGHAGHNGLRDIVAVLGSKEFYRLRVGIGRPLSVDQVVDYVLTRPSRDEDEAIRGALDKACELVPSILAGEFQKVMNSLHAAR